MSTLLAIDPSLAAPGYAVLDLSYSEPRLLAAGVIETKRAAEDKRRSVFEDNMRRARFIRRELGRVFVAHRPRVIAVEAAGGSQSANAIAAMMISQTVVACLVDEHLEGGVPVYATAHEVGAALGISPTQRAKKGEKKTSSQRNAARKTRKGAIARVVIERLGESAWRRALQVIDASASCWEGAHDAAAVGLAVWDRPEVAAIRMMARQVTIEERIA